jgi:hypothetical protein
MMSLGNCGVYQLLEEVTFRAIVVFFTARYSHKNVLDHRNLLLTDLSGQTIISVEQLRYVFSTIESNRAKYPTFESFFPEFVKFLNDYSIKAKL